MYNVKEKYEYIFQTYGEKLYRSVLFMCKNVQDSEDITQNTFLKLYTTETVFETEIHVKNWIYKIALNEVKNLKKSKWFQRKSIEEVEQVIMPKEQLGLYHTLMKLSDSYRVVIILYYYEGYSIREIASILDKKVSTIQTQLQRGRKKLKLYLESEKDE